MSVHLAIAITELEFTMSIKARILQSDVFTTNWATTRSKSSTKCFDLNHFPYFPTVNGATRKDRILLIRLVLTITTTTAPSTSTIILFSANVSYREHGSSYSQADGSIQLEE
jgi:hypothetical protein